QDAVSQAARIRCASGNGGDRGQGGRDQGGPAGEQARPGLRRHLETSPDRGGRDRRGRLRSMWSTIPNGLRPCYGEPCGNTWISCSRFWTAACKKTIARAPELAACLAIKCGST